jgi:hypothetical protein
MGNFFILINSKPVFENHKIGINQEDSQNTLECAQSCAAVAV